MSSICPTGKATSTSSPPAVSNQTVAQQLSYEFPIITAPASRTARVDVKARHGVLLDLPKLPEVSLRLGHDHSKGFCDVRALVDSGANASLMRDHLVSYFVEAGIIKTTDVVPLESPVHVGGISDSVLATHTATVCAASGGLEDAPTCIPD
ncbi:hypothetical protein FOL47_005721 [Perkinsus chesapeaki]|uniref:Peptidase A2 domain-containing protein n=1 Tax=Perkinsus chesapeaki TaxID=330153 RepID=A0A7J6KHW7_PERCH|nr:hypothetical protein FOL47_005721 [Perkinsus chesapeaki]